MKNKFIKLFTSSLLLCNIIASPAHIFAQDEVVDEINDEIVEEVVDEIIVEDGEISTLAAPYNSMVTFNVNGKVFINDISPVYFSNEPKIAHQLKRRFTFSIEYLGNRYTDGVVFPGEHDSVTKTSLIDNGNFGLTSIRITKPGTFAFIVYQLVDTPHAYLYSLDTTPRYITVNVGVDENNDLYVSDITGDIINYQTSYYDREGNASVQFFNYYNPDTPPITNPDPVYTTDTYTELEEIPFVSETIEDDELELGVTEVRQAGVNGQKEITYEQTYEDGEPYGEPVVTSEVVISEPINEIIAVGTKIIESDPDTSEESSEESESQTPDESDDETESSDESESQTPSESDDESESNDESSSQAPSESDDETEPSDESSSQNSSESNSQKPVGPIDETKPNNDGNPGSKAQPNNKPSTPVSNKNEDDKPALPNTGENSSFIIAAVGLVLLASGSFLVMRSKRKTK